MKGIFCLMNPAGEVVCRREHDPANDVWAVDAGWRLAPEAECAGLPEAAPLPPKLMPVTKLMIMERLGEKWPVLKAVLSTMPEMVQDAWTLAQEINPNHGLFLEHKAALQAALGLSDAEFNGLFAPS